MDVHNLYRIYLIANQGLEFSDFDVYYYIHKYSPNDINVPWVWNVRSLKVLNWKNAD